MSDRYPVLAGCEAWSHPGLGERAHIGLVMVHGFTGNPSSLRPFAETLASRGYSVELLRLPGHGTSFRDLARTRYADYRREVQRGLDEILRKCRDVVLIGFSAGGTLVLDIASERSSDLRGVVVINPLVLDREGVLPKIAPLLEKWIPALPSSWAGMRKDDIRKPGMREQAYDWLPAAPANSLMRELSRVRRNLPHIRCPVLVAHSREDHTVPPENSQELLKLLNGKEITDLVLEQSYHVAPLDLDADLLASRTAAFVDRAAANARLA